MNPKRVPTVKFYKAALIIWIMQILKTNSKTNSKQIKIKCNLQMS